MSRDDSLLYTGQTSSSLTPPVTAKLAKKREGEKQERIHKRNVLEPSGKLIVELIDKELTKVMLVKNIEVENASDPQMFMVEMLARKKYTEYLTGLSASVKSLLSREEVVDGDSFNE